MGVTRKNYCPDCDTCLESFYWCKRCQSTQFEENFDNWTTGDKGIDDFIKETQLKANDCTDYLEWIPFNAFIGVNKYDKSEVGTVYTANWKKGPKDCWDENDKKYVARRELIKVALHSLGNSPPVFLKALKRHYYSRVKSGLMIRLFGVTRESVTGHLMMVAETVEWDLRHYVSHHFARLTWSRKISILYTIACALEQLHNGEQVHRDRTTNGQFFKNHLEIPVNELGLGDSKDSIPIIGYYKNDLLPFMPPEILRNENYSGQSDIYSFGILMWELSTEQSPFFDYTNDKELVNDIRNNIRPEIDDQIPKCVVDLLKRCWDPDPINRPSAETITGIINEWIWILSASKIRLSSKSKDILNQFSSANTTTKKKVKRQSKLPLSLSRTPTMLRNNNYYSKSLSKYMTLLDVEKSANASSFSSTDSVNTVTYQQR